MAGRVGRVPRFAELVELPRRVLEGEFGPALRRALRAIQLLFEPGFREALTLRASALTYLTLLAVVPLLAVVYSIVDVFGGMKGIDDSLREFVAQNIAVGARQGVLDYIDTFVHNANASAVGGVGFFFLLASSLSLLWNMESAFNHIWGSQRARGLAVRGALYWCFLTVGPILLAISVTLTAKVAGPHGLGPHHSEWQHALLAVSSASATYAGFFVLYRLLPTAKVQKRAALFGALIAGTAWELAKVGYAHLATHLVRFDAIYGSLSAIPIFLLWIYVSWIVLLAGCRLAYAQQHSRALPPPSEAIGGMAWEVVTARVAIAVAQRFEAGRGEARAAGLSHELQLPKRLVSEALRALRRAGLLAATRSGFALTRPASRITLSEIRLAARASAHVPRYVADGSGEGLVALLSAADASIDAQLARPLSALLNPRE